MKRKKKNNKTALILVLILLISVGYAALASNLKINGSSKVKAAKWDVYWNNVQITNGSVPADNDHKARITDSGKTQVEFSIELNEPGDYYEFTVDAVNNGTIDAMIAAEGISKGTYSDSNYTTTATLPDSVSYTVTYADGTAIEEKHLLAKKTNDTPTVETYKVRIEYKNDDSVDPEDLDNDNDHTYYFKFSVNYVQADNTAIPSHSAIHYVTRQNEGQITAGDVIRIGDTENFYVVSSDAQKTVLLAKYNLMVGMEYDDYCSVRTLINPDTTAGYGLQNVDTTIVACYDAETGDPMMNGVAAFSSTYYWDDGDWEHRNLLSPYNANGASYEGNPYPYVYNSSLTTAPDFSSECDWSTNCWNTSGYSIAYYVEQYKARLIEMGAPSTITGRLLSYEEADSAKTIEDNGVSIIFNNNGYWLGSARNYDFVSRVSEAYFPYAHIDDIVAGVRPVIEIPTSEIR